MVQKVVQCVVMWSWHWAISESASKCRSAYYNNSCIRLQANLILHINTMPSVEICILLPVIGQGYQYCRLRWDPIYPRTELHKILCIICQAWSKKLTRFSLKTCVERSFSKLSGQNWHNSKKSGHDQKIRTNQDKLKKSGKSGKSGQVGPLRLSSAVAICNDGGTAHSADEARQSVTEHFQLPLHAHGTTYLLASRLCPRCQPSSGDSRVCCFPVATRGTDNSSWCAGPMTVQFNLFCNVTLKFFLAICHVNWRSLTN